MKVEVSEETAETLFRVLTEEKQENFELKRITERVDELIARNEELEGLHAFGDEECRKEQIEATRLIKFHAGQFFMKEAPPESYTFIGKLTRLINVLKELAEHEKVNRRCQSIVLALGAIEKKTKFVVHYRVPGQGGVVQREGAISKVQHGSLRLVKRKNLVQIPITSIEKIEVADDMPSKKEDKKK